MAILDELGLEVEIEVAGEPAPEYPDPEHDTNDNDGDNGSQTNVHHYYVESRAGEEFCISIGIVGGDRSPAARWVAEKDHCLQFSVSLDGGDFICNYILNATYRKRRILGVTNYTKKEVNHSRFSSVSTGTL